MNPVNSIENIKKVLHNVDVYGGDTSFHLSQNTSLLINIRKFIYNELKQQNISIKRDRYRNAHFIDDILDRHRFEQRIEYCIIKLREFDIDENKYFDLIKTALNKVIENINNDSFFNRGYIKYDEDVELKIDELLIDELVKCFAIWYFPDDLYFYRFAIEHNLIGWKDEIQKWYLTNIGNYALKLSTFELIIFVLSSEITFSKDEHHHSNYINKRVLTEILNKSPKKEFKRRARVPQILRFFNLVNEHLSPTDFGYRILNTVRNRIEELIELNLLLIETELSGFSFSFKNDNEKSILNRIQNTLDSNILDRDVRTSMKTALDLYIKENYLDCLRIFYSNLEIILNKPIAAKGENPDNLRGMRPKIDKLIKEKVISPKLGTWLEVVASRNKIIHGNIVENDSTVLKPLFEIIGLFWVDLITELEMNS